MDNKSKMFAYVMTRDVEALIQMRTVETLCKELSANKEVPAEMVQVYKETAKKFKEMIRSYSKGREFSTKTKAVSIKHFEAAYKHLEEAVKGPGAGFTTKFIKKFSERSMYAIKHIIFRSRRKAYRVATKRQNHG